MSTVDELKRQRESLERTLNSGAASIRHGDKQVTHRSSSEIERQLKRLDDQIAAAEGLTRRPRLFHIRQDRGF